MRTIVLLTGFAVLAACGGEPPAQQSGGNAAVSPPKAEATAETQAQAPTPKSPEATTAAAGPCRTQDGAALPAIALRAIGTEPFWGARIDGRCVTYSHPENQAGTRIWTRFSGSAESGTWSGFYRNQRFELRTRPEAGCSDGMSDNRYPLAVALTVAGEQRTGCAEPATGR